MIRRIRSEKERKLYGRIVRNGNVLTDTGRKRKIVGTWGNEIAEVMKRLGYSSKELPCYGKLTLREFCEDSGHMGPFIVMTSNHFVAISHGAICDTITKHPIAWTEYKGLRSRIQKVYRF